MDTLKNKRYESFNYISRKTGIPYYYDSLGDRDVFGIGSNLKKDTAYVSHKVVQEDTLDSLALEYYNNPTLWWAIAYFNDIQDAFIKLSEHYTILKIPSITSIEFNQEN